MKKIYAILAVAAAFACTAFAVTGYSSRDPFFEANVEALMNDEGIKAKICYVDDRKYGVWEQALFCDERTDIGTIYTCPSESWGYKFSLSTDRCINQ
jgi:hypothetical protein